MHKVRTRVPLIPLYNLTNNLMADHNLTDNLTANLTDNLTANLTDNLTMHQPLQVRYASGVAR